MSREIYLDHPQHGAHVVYNEGDVVEMGKKGWVRRDPQPGATKAAPEPPKAAESTPAAPEAPKAKAGKKK